MPPPNPRRLKDAENYRNAILRVLARAKEPVLTKDLRAATAVHSNGQRWAHAIRKLLDDGDVLRRDVDPGFRNVHYELTDAGREKVASLPARAA